MKLATRMHMLAIHRGRTAALADLVAAVLPPGATVLDVGCGDGLPALAIMERRPDVSITGIDVMVRDYAYIDVRSFDGRQIPLDDAAVDVVLFTDVLHHTHDKHVLLAEAARVCAKAVVIKDHLCDGAGARVVLSAMDWVGNRHSGVALPYAYWSSSQWRTAFAASGLSVRAWNERLKLYPAPANALFGGKKHVLAVLEPSPERPIESGHSPTSTGASASRSAASKLSPATIE